MTRSWSRAMGARASTAASTCFSWISAMGVSPRSRRALPPNAATIRISIADRGHHGGLDGVEPVLCLVEDDRSRRLKDLVSDFESAESPLLVKLAAYLGLGVVQRGEAVHELGVWVAGGLH